MCTYWARHTDESGLSVDFAEAHERCWRCGCRRRLERCHIVPDSLGGEDIPSNFVILCKRCHLDNPNVADPEIMWDWLRAYSVPLYDTFWDIPPIEFPGPEPGEEAKDGPRHAAPKGVPSTAETRVIASRNASTVASAFDGTETGTAVLGTPLPSADADVTLSFIISFFFKFI